MLTAPWVTPAELPESLPKLDDGAQVDLLCSVASEMLYGLSGRRWGGSATARVEVVSYGSWEPSLPLAARLLWHESWGLCLAAGSPSHDGCQRRASVRLPDFPVTAVLSVSLDGEVLPADSYRVVAGRFLERVSGVWPTCGRGLDVTYRHGVDPPEGGVYAARELAAQLVLGAAGSSDCRLPENVTSITRQGVTMTQDSMSKLVELGHTGLYGVDLWLRTVNPHRATRRSRVWFPEQGTARRTPPLP